MNYIVIDGGKNTYKMTLHELYNMLNNKCNDINLSCIIKINDDYRMPDSIVNEWLHRRINKEKVLHK